MTGELVLHLVRHGESAGNVDPSLGRSADPPLTDRGRAQARRAAEALAARGIRGVYTSPVRRARETADVIATATGAAVEVVDGFAEVGMGLLSDASAPADRAERDAIFGAWLAGDRSRGFPGGEDWASVVRRVSDGLRDVCARAPASPVVIVAHRMPIAAAASLCGHGAARAGGACANGSITTVVRRTDGTWELLAWGEAGHLAGV